MLMILIIVAAATCYILFLRPVLAYFLDSKKLRQYPAPSVAGFTSLWRIWHNLQHNHYLVVHDAHRKLGTHVRISPNHLSINSPRAMADLHGHGNTMTKDGWYDAGAGDFRSMSDARDKVVHQQKRRLLAHVFAQSTIVDLEPFVVLTLNQLLTRLQGFATADHYNGKPLNFRRYINYFTIDLFSYLLFSRSAGTIEQGDDLLTAETADGKLYKAHFIQSLHDSVRINTVMGFEPKLYPITKPFFDSWHPGRKSGKDFENIVYHLLMERTRNQPPPAADSKDIFSRFMTNNKNEELNLPRGEILAEAGLLMNAGTDTTSAVMTNVIYLLCKNPEVQRKLQAELDETMKGVQIIAKYEQVAKLPYLRGVIEETLRLRPSIAIGLPREVPKGGKMVAGRWIEEGVTVSVPQYTLFRHPDHFEQCDRFWPERWIEGNKALMNQAYMPFSTGPRACIGRNISYFEMLLVISALVRAFDFELVDPDYELKVMERFNANPGELWLKVKQRHT